MNNNYIKGNFDDESPWFEELFYHELESWFDCQELLCDSCVEEFISMWYGAYKNDPDLQRNQISLDLIYEGSRMSSEYSRKEFKRFIKEIECPNCGTNLQENIWPYELPISTAIANGIKEVADTFKKTPFLMLNCSFAKDVYECIKQMGHNNIPILITNKFYRGRAKKDCSKKFTYSDFAAPPPEIVQEGRFNHAGQPTLYLADTIRTTFKELRNPEKGIGAAKVVVRKPLKILDFTDDTLKDNEIFKGMRLSSIVTPPEEGEGWNRPQYIFTRFIRDCALDSKFDAIKYPSVRYNSGTNLAIINPDIIDEVVISEIQDYLEE